jgi:hypothetical protein
MINGLHLGRLIELAFDYLSAETEQQANQVHDQVAKFATEASTFTMWLNLIDHIREWNSSNGHNYPMSWASALQFLSTRQAELNPLQTGGDQ